MDDMNRNSGPFPAKTTYSYNKTYGGYLKTLSERQRVFTGVTPLDFLSFASGTLCTNVYIASIWEGLINIGDCKSSILVGRVGVEPTAR